MSYPTQMPALSIGTTTVQHDNEGRYCLNDLHRAAGGEKRHQPSDWLRLDQTQEIVREMEIPGNPGIVARQGLGTFVPKELVYSYAMWISPAFHLHVVREFDRLQRQQAPATYIAALEALIVAEKAKEAALLQAQTLAQQITAERPLVELAKSLTGDSTITRREWLGLMKDDSGLNLTETELTKFLLEQGYCYRDQMDKSLRAYAQYGNYLKLEAAMIDGYRRMLLTVTGAGVERLTPIVLQHFSACREAR